MHFCTATVDGWQPLLDEAAVAVLYSEWESCGTAFDVRVLAYVVMPEHMHLLLWSERAENVKRFMQRVLSHSSKRIGRGGKFWKERMRVVCVYSEDVLKTKLDYIHANAVKRGLVAVAEQWRHSSFGELELGSPGVGFRCDPWPEGVLLP